MVNILYFFTILIMISGSFYPAFALDTSQTCDTITLPPRWPSSHIYITDTNESLPYTPLTDHTAIFHDDDVWNTSTQPRDVNVTLTIQDKVTGQQVFNQTQSLQMNACSGPESVKWRFVPIQIANYDAKVSDNRGTVGMIFYSILDTAKSQTISSPLEQLKFGINSHNVVCKQDLHLVIKSEDGSPACVKSDTAQKLIERGWTVNSQITYPCPTTDPSKISVDFPLKLPAVLPNGYSLQGIEQNGRIQVYAYYANKPLCTPDHNFQFHDIQILVTIGKQQWPLPSLEYYQLIPQLVGNEWDIPLGPNLISELANEGITVQPLEINGYKGFGWVPWDTPVSTEQLHVIDPNQTASSLFFYNNNDQDVYALFSLDHQSVVWLSNIARSIPP